MTYPHPLVSDDSRLIQDYQVTKLTMFLATEAEDGEWAHELEEQRAISGDDWQRQNAFLFDYTVARFIATQSHDGADKDLGPSRRFVRDFVSAVDTQNYVSAEMLWNAMNRYQVATQVGTTVPSTIALILELRACTPRIDLGRVVTSLPPEFERPQYVS